MTAFWLQLREGLLTALTGVLTLSVPVVSGYIVRYLVSLTGVKLTEAQQSQLEYAAKKGVAAAAETMRDAIGEGARKQQLATKVAQSLAPEAFKKLSVEQTAAVIQGTYAEMKPSLSFTGLAPITDAQIAGAAPLPPPSAVPKAVPLDRPTPLPPLRGPVGPGAKGGPT